MPITRDLFCRGLVNACIASLAIAGCGDSSRVETWEINHHEQECVGVEATLCLLVRTPGMESWRFSFGINGFRFTPGVVTTAQIRITEDKNPAADGSSEIYELERILTKEPVSRSTTYEISVRESPSVQKTGSTNYQLFRQMNITCEPALCDQIDAAIASETSVLLEFDHRASPAGPWPIRRVKCSASMSEFLARCRGESDRT